MKNIHVGNMVFPKRNKLQRYREYYEKKQCFAHAIVVDENNNIRDGYTTYIIANEENVRAEVFCIHSSEKCKKIVIGNHVVFDGENYRACSDKEYSWQYELKEAVVPGDILLVNTSIGNRFICVNKVSYVFGEKCSSYKPVKKFIAKAKLFF